VLVVEDETADFDLVVQRLQRSGLSARCCRVDNEEDYRSQLQAQPDIILSDYSLPSFSALHALQTPEKAAWIYPSSSLPEW